MPNTSRISAMGIWMIGCKIMVFGALTEYGILLFLTIMSKNTETPLDQKMSALGFEIKDRTHIEEGTKKHCRKIEINNTMLMTKLDSISLFMFPIIFIIFIVVYVFFLLA